MTEEKAQAFRPINVGFRPMEHDKFSQLGVVYEMDFDMRSFDRRIFTVLDWLSDVGGLSGALFSIVGIIIGILTANDMHWYLIENTFKRKQLDPTLVNE